VASWVWRLGVRGAATGACLFGGRLAVVGEAGGAPAVALLDRESGEVLAMWRGEGAGFFGNCLSHGGALYAAGWVEAGGRQLGTVYIFDKDLNPVEKVEAGGGGLHALAHDGDYLYAAGFAVEDVDGDRDEEWIWRIERMADLSAFKFVNIYADGWDTGVVLDMAINPATGHLWAVGGYRDAAGVVHSLLVLIDRELREVRRVEHSLGWLHGICFDEEDNGYAAGREGVAKFDKAGRPTANRRLPLVFDENLNPVGKRVFAETYSGFLFGRSAFDGKSLYIAGNDIALGEYRIVVYSISLAVRMMVQVVDGFGRVRDWPVEVVGVAADRGAVGVEVLPGRYTVKATAFGREYAQTVEVKPSQNQTVTIQVPTAVLNIVA